MKEDIFSGNLFKKSVFFTGYSLRNLILKSNFYGTQTHRHRQSRQADVQTDTPTELVYRPAFLESDLLCIYIIGFNLHRKFWRSFFVPNNARFCPKKEKHG